MSHESEPLSTLMAAGPMPVSEVLRIARETAEALAGSVHGELWPSAILVAPDAVTIEPPGGIDRSRYGQYAAPERILGQPPTSASDVFSLAAILFHALAGRPPFRGASPAEVMLAICADVPLDLRSLRPQVPPQLSALLQRCLAREVSQRPASMGVFRDLLEALTAKDNFPGRRILVADDEATLREFYVRMASRIGVEADVVSGGRDAIAAFKSQRYEVALLDLNMPRLSGWEVLDFLRSRPEVRPRRIFVVTGFSDQNLSAADRELVSAVLYKPVVIEELRDLVVACLEGGDVNVAAILRTTGHRVLAAA